MTPRWKTLISNYSDVDEKNLFQNHQVIKGDRILSSDKLSCNEIYSNLISNNVNKHCEKHSGWVQKEISFIYVTFFSCLFFYYLII